MNRDIQPEVTETIQHRCANYKAFVIPTAKPNPRNSDVDDDLTRKRRAVEDKLERQRYDQDDVDLGFI